MEHITTQKIFNSGLSKVAEDNFEVSPCKTEKTKKTESEDNSFSFSFSSFAPSEVSKPKENRKIQFGLNLLISYHKSILKHCFKLVKKSNLRENPAAKLLKFLFRKRKRVYFIKWYVQSIKILSENKLNCANQILEKMNLYSKSFISCFMLFSVLKKHNLLISQKYFYLLLNKNPNYLEFKETSLISAKTTEKWVVTGLIKLVKLFEKQKTIKKFNFFKLLNNDLSLQRKSFIQNTDRCIILSEQLFEAKEAKEKAEFEKEELAAVLESKTDELNKLLDMVEEYKAWQFKINNIEGRLNEEIFHWKSQANSFSAELDKKNKEIIEVYSDKKKAEEECLKAYRNLDLAQRLNLEIQKKNSENDESEKDCINCKNFKKEIETYNELIEEFKKSEEKNLLQIKELQDLSSKPSTFTKSKTKPLKKPAKKTLEFEKQPMSENESQFAVEIVNLNKQLNKLKHENKSLSEILKKCQHERDELKRLMIGKDESLSRLRKENESLSLSLSSDHYKSVQKLENNSNLFEQKNKELGLENFNLQKNVEEMKKMLEKLENENENLKNKIFDLENSQKTCNESPKLAENLTSLQNQFYRLKEMSDRQIQTIESLKQDNFQLMQSIESYKSFARSSKLHADKANNDAEAYVGLIKKMEAEIVALNSEKNSAESEVLILKQHIMKLINSR